MQVCLSLYGVSVPLVMKELIRSMFMATLSALQETIKNKIRLLAHYWLIYFLTYFLFTLHDIYYYMYNNYYWISLLKFPV